MTPASSVARPGGLFAPAAAYQALSREFEGKPYEKVRPELLRRGYRPLRFDHPDDLGNAQCEDGFCKRFPESLNCTMGPSYCDFVLLSPAHKLIAVISVGEVAHTVTEVRRPDMFWMRERGYPAALTAAPTTSEKLYWKFHGWTYAKARPELLRLGYRPASLNHSLAQETDSCPGGLCKRYPELLNCWSRAECDFVFKSPGGELIDIDTKGDSDRVIVDVLEPDVPNGIRLPSLRALGYRPKSPDRLCEPGAMVWPATKTCPHRQ
jgi:hypothetical protein